MKNKFVPVIIIFVAVFASISIFYFITNSNQSDNNLPTSSMGSNSAETNENSENTDSVSDVNKYIQYEEGQLEKYNDKRIVLYFYANWCPTCRPADLEIQERQTELPSDVVVIRVNYNDNATDSAEEQLAEKYNITYQHTFVLLENSQESSRWIGGSIDKILSELE